MYSFKLKYCLNKKKRNTEGQRSKGCFFQMFYTFDDSRKKQKYRFIFLFFLNGWRSVRDEGIRNENSKKDEELNGWKQAESKRERETDRDQRRVWTSIKEEYKQKSASHCSGPPSHLPTSLLQVTQCEMENRATDTVVHSVVNNHQVRNSEGDLTLRLSMQGSTLGFVI